MANAFLFDFQFKDQVDLLSVSSEAPTRAEMLDAGRIQHLVVKRCPMMVQVVSYLRQRLQLRGWKPG